MYVYIYTQVDPLCMHKMSKALITLFIIYIYIYISRMHARVRVCVGVFV